MILSINKHIKFSNYYKKLNLFSLILIFLSLVLLLFKGLNFGVDFKGGTLIEIRTNASNINIGDTMADFTLWDVNGDSIKLATILNNGKKEGEWLWYYPNGNKKTMGIYKDDTQNGKPIKTLRWIACCRQN